MKSSRVVSYPLILVACAIVAAALCSGTALAASAPTVETGTASNVGLVSAVLNGTYNPNGAVTSYSFEYGETLSYGSSTPNWGQVSGSKEHEASQTATGLKPETTYHFRIKASNEFGTTFGADETFTTPTWHIEGQTLAELEIEGESYSSQGMFKIELPELEVIFENCEEKGYGVIGVEEHMTLSNCELVGLEEVCTVEPIKFSLDDRFSSVWSILTVIVTKGGSCPWFENVEVPDGGFVVENGPEGEALPISLSQLTGFGLNPMYISGSSTWVLNGARAGEELGIS